MEKDFSESISLFAPQVDRKTGTLRHCALLGQVSANNRFYTTKALETVRKLADQLKAFLNHDSRGVENLIGDFSNLVIENNKVYGDVSILESCKYRDMIFELAENKPHLCGWSIHARGLFGANDSEGREVVEDIVLLRSIDLVADPATNSSVWESKEEEPNLEQINAQLIIRNTELQEELEKALADKRFFREAFRKCRMPMTEQKEHRKLSLEEARAITGKKE